MNTVEYQLIHKTTVQSVSALDTGQQLDSLSANFTYKRCTLGTECTAHIKGAHLARDVLQLHAWGALAVQDQTPKTTTVSLCASTPLAKNTIQYCIFQYRVCTYSVFELGPFGSSSFLLSSTMPIKLTLTFIILHILHTETDLKFILLPQVNKAGCVDLCSLILLPLCSLRALTNKSGDNVSHRVKLKGTFSDLSSYDGFTPAHQGSILATLQGGQGCRGEGGPAQGGGCQQQGRVRYNRVDVGSDEQAQFNPETVVGEANSGLEQHR